MAQAAKQPKTAAKAATPAMPRRPRAPRERLNFRIDPRIKQRAEDAAQYLGQDLSTFAESALDLRQRRVEGLRLVLIHR